MLPARTLQAPLFAWGAQVGRAVPWPWLAAGVLHLPVYLALWQGQWQQGGQELVPVLLAVAWLCLLLPAAQSAPPEHGTGGRWGGWRNAVLMGLGAASYLLGRTLQLDLLAAAAIVFWLPWLSRHCPPARPGLAALLLLLTLPYPAWLVEGITSPLRQGISATAAAILHGLDYPVARSGVVLAIDGYRLLVADACAGLHSLFVLLAVGGLYLFLPQRQQQRRGWPAFLLLLALIPLALLANLLRVLVLLLLTYHGGDALAQSGWHDLAGLLGYGLCLLLLGSAARRYLPSVTAPIAIAAPGRSRPSVTWRLALCLLLLWPLALWLEPQQRLAAERQLPALAQLLPERVGDWQQEPPGLTVPVQATAGREQAAPYQQSLARSYVDPLGRRVTLVLAYGDQQLGQAWQLHRPEFCYPAQGFELLHQSDHSLAGGWPVRHLLARQGSRLESISYWLLVGDTPALPGWGRQWAQLRYGLRGQIADGLLLRVSSLGPDAQAAYRLQAQFLRELATAVPPALSYAFPSAP